MLVLHADHVVVARIGQGWCTSKAFEAQVWVSVRFASLLVGVCAHFGLSTKAVVGVGQETSNAVRRIHLCLVATLVSPHLGQLMHHTSSSHLGYLGPSLLAVS